jgi:FtsH-binding integral membrane protein
MTEKFNPFEFLSSALAIASFGGLAALLRSKQRLSPRAVVAAIIYSGISGLIVFLLLCNYCGAENVHLLLGVSGLAGIGNVTVIDFLIQAAKSGLNINISTRKENDNDEHPDS